MNNKNATAVAIGANRSSSLAMDTLDISNDMVRHQSISKPGTNNVSPRMAGTLETGSIRYINNGNSVQQSQRSSLYHSSNRHNPRLQLYKNNNANGRNSANEMLASNSSADNEASPVPGGTFKRVSSILNERGSAKNMIANARGSISPMGVRPINQNDKKINEKKAKLLRPSSDLAGMSVRASAR